MTPQEAAASLYSTESAPISPQDAATSLYQSSSTTEKEPTFEDFQRVMTERHEKAAQAMYTGILDSVGGIAQKAAGAMSKIGNTTAARALWIPGLGSAGAILAEQASAAKTGIESHYQDQLQQFEQNDLPGKGIARLAGGMAGSMPMNPLFKGASAAVGAMPTIPQRLGMGVAAGAGLGAAAGATQMDLTNRDDLFNTKEAAKGALAGAALGGILGVIPTLKTYKSDYKASEDAVNGMIRKMSPDIAQIQNPAQAQELASRVVGQAKKRMEDAAKELWQPINNVEKSLKLTPDTISNVKTKITDYLSTYGDDLSSSIRKNLNNITEKSDVSLKELRDLRTYIGGLYPQIKKAAVPGALENARALNKVGRELLDDVRDTISAKAPTLLEGFEKANSFSKVQFDIMKDSGKSLKKALVDATEGYAFINRLLTEKGPTKTLSKFQIFSPNEATQMRASLLKNGLTNSIEPNGVMNLTKFLDFTKHPNQEAIMGESYKSLKGLSEIISTKVASPRLDLKYMVNDPGIVQGSTILRLTNAALAKLQPKTPLKKALVQANYIKSNDKLYPYLEGLITRFSKRLGIVYTMQPDNSILIDAKENE